jgi:hypothetical protein
MHGETAFSAADSCQFWRASSCKLLLSSASSKSICCSHDVLSAPSIPQDRVLTAGFGSSPASHHRRLYIPSDASRHRQGLDRWIDLFGVPNAPLEQIDGVCYLMESIRRVAVPKRHHLRIQPAASVFFNVSRSAPVWQNEVARNPWCSRRGCSTTPSSRDAQPTASLTRRCWINPMFGVVFSLGSYVKASSASSSGLHSTRFQPPKIPR